MYHKIQNLFKRDTVTHRLTDELSNPVALGVRRWDATEKLDGMNIRVTLLRSPCPPYAYSVELGGKTDNAQMQKSWIDYILKFFPVEKVASMPERLWDSNDRIVIYGELCGPKINGNNHGLLDLFFALFDAEGKRFLPQDLVQEIGLHFGVPMAPTLKYSEGLTSIIDWYKGGCKVLENDGCREGVVIRPTEGDLFDRFGNRMIFKLKLRDLR